MSNADRGTAVTLARELLTKENVDSELVVLARQFLDALERERDLQRKYVEAVDPGTEPSRCAKFSTLLKWCEGKAMAGEKRKPDEIIFDLLSGDTFWPTVTVERLAELEEREAPQPFTLKVEVMKDER
jgi:hypothetical protein